MSYGKIVNHECKICAKILVSSKSMCHILKKHNISYLQYYNTYLRKEGEGICLKCGKETPFMSITLGYQKHCSLKCSQTNPERLKKFRETYLSHDLEQIKKKRENTNLERYGNISANRNEEVKLRSVRNSELNRVPKYLQMIRDWNLELLTTKEYFSKSDILKFKCLKCNKEFEDSIFNVGQRTYKCPHEVPYNISVNELEVLKFIESITSEEILTHKRIEGYEIDILLPNKKLAIEYNGLYWHSEIVITTRNPVTYHVNKLETCNKNGYNLVQIFEDEWNEKKEIVKARLKRIIGNSNQVQKIHARQCVIKQIEANIKNNFLKEFHLQGSDICSISLGAFYDEKLVSVMTFSKGNVSKGSLPKEGVWELSRFCSDYNFHVQGIASKLLEYFKRNYPWKEIYSYADRRWSNGNLYYKLGFELEKITEPNYWYTKDGYKRIHRFNLRKKAEEPKDIPEWQLRQKEGYYRVWDCGNLKFNMYNAQEV